MPVGMPQQIWLEEFGEHVRRAFGHVPYHVGSSFEKKDGWRDVDVRLMLPDEEFAAMFPHATPDHMQRDPKWVSTILAWSALGKAVTGLPIDFQIQQRSYANEQYPNGRSALFVVCEAYERSRLADEAAKREAAEEDTNPRTNQRYR